MAAIPHPDGSAIAVRCAVITVSDTRNVDTDRSGQLIQQLLMTQGHSVPFYTILPDEVAAITAELHLLAQQTELDVVILNGGTGIAPRDTTYDVVEQLLDKVIPGFGELFRFLSYQEVGSRAIASRAIGGIYQGKLLFSLPGSTNAVRLAMEKLILPEVVHLVKQMGRGK